MSLVEDKDDWAGVMTGADVESSSVHLKMKKKVMEDVKVQLGTVYLGSVYRVPRPKKCSCNLTYLGLRHMDSHLDRR